jgi:hypothetical protein
MRRRKALKPLFMHNAKEFCEGSICTTVLQEFCQTFDVFDPFVNVGKNKLKACPEDTGDWARAPLIIEECGPQHVNPLRILGLCLSTIRSEDSFDAQNLFELTGCSSVLADIWWHDRWIRYRRVWAPFTERRLHCPTSSGSRHSL